VVRVSGIPPGVPPQGLSNWLQPARPFGGSRGVHYDLDERGFFTGEALVELEGGQSLEAALTKHGLELQGAVVEVGVDGMGVGSAWVGADVCFCA